jgi:hypothetical protein
MERYKTKRASATSAVKARPILTIPIRHARRLELSTNDAVFGYHHAARKKISP